MSGKMSALVRYSLRCDTSNKSIILVNSLGSRVYKT